MLAVAATGERGSKVRNHNQGVDLKGVCYCGGGCNKAE